MQEKLPSPCDLAPFFLAEFPEVILRATCRHILSAYKEVEDTCRSFPPEPAHDLRPIYRRAAVERNVFSLNGRYPGVSVAYFPNDGNNCFHAIIRAGRTFLTISCVDNPQQIVRTAIFRNQYSAQQDLFLHNELPPSDNELYAILLHGQAKKDTAYPSFVRIVFPNNDCTEYCNDYIDLISIFSEIREQVPVTEIPVPQVPPLRQMPKAEGNA
jgi:hypothetical protein